MSVLLKDFALGIEMCNLFLFKGYLAILLFLHIIVWMFFSMEGVFLTYTKEVWIV